MQNRSKTLTQTAFYERVECKLKDWLPCNISNTKDLEAEVETFEAVVRETVDEFIPAKPRPTKLDALTYWNKKLQSLKNKEAELYHAFQTNKTEASALELHKAKIKFAKANRYEKRKSFPKWTSSRETISQVSRMHKILNSKGSNELGLLQKQDGSITTSPKDSIDELINVNFPKASDTKVPKREDFKH